tara:strand:+ start:1555 stop:1668 length:114 start_codon:yes stop_codon:yes gene_type:complete
MQVALFLLEDVLAVAIAEAESASQITIPEHLKILDGL